MFTIISFFQKLIKGGGGWNKSGGGLENFSKINKRGGGDDYSVLESKFIVLLRWSDKGDTGYGLIYAFQTRPCLCGSSMTTRKRMEQISL